MECTKNAGPLYSSVLLYKITLVANKVVENIFWKLVNWIIYTHFWKFLVFTLCFLPREPRERICKLLCLLIYKLKKLEKISLVQNNIWFFSAVLLAVARAKPNKWLGGGSYCYASWLLFVFVLFSFLSFEMVILIGGFNNAKFWWRR